MTDNSYAKLMDPASERAKRGAFFFLMLFAAIIFAMWDLARFLWGGHCGARYIEHGRGCCADCSDARQPGAGDGGPQKTGSGR